MWAFSIDGLIRTKKNNRVSALVKTKKPRMWRGEICHHRVINVENATYQKWEQNTVWQLLQQKQRLPDVFPLRDRYNVAAVIRVPDYRTRDLLNLLAGVMDALVKAGILVDDSWMVAYSHDGSCVRVDKRRPGCDIVITPIERGEADG